MKNRRILTFLFLFALMALCSERANACWDPAEGLMVCLRCDGGFPASACQLGCAGEFCSKSFGECCDGRSFTVSNPSGTCPPEECISAPTSRRATHAHVRSAPRAADWRGMSSLVLVPSRCSGSYIVANGI